MSTETQALRNEIARVYTDLRATMPAFTVAERAEADALLDEVGELMGMLDAETSLDVSVRRACGVALGSA